MSLAQKIKNWIKDILDAVGINQYTDLERAYRAWEKAVAKAENTVKTEQRKGNVISNDARVENERRTVYSEDELNEIIEKDYQEQVRETLHTKINDGNQVRIMKSTPSILKQCGLNDLPMQITRGHLRDINHEKVDNNDKYHGISEELINKLPELLANPLIVFDSISRQNPNAVCVLTGQLDADGLPIIIAICPDGTGRFNNVTVDSNVVLSMYGKKNPQQFINKLNKNINNVLMINKIRTRKLLNAARLQLPAGLNNLKSNYIIHQSKNVVKSNGAKNSEGKLDYLIKENKNDVDNIDNSDIITDREQMFADDQRQLDNVVMKAQIKAKKKLGYLPGRGYAYTNDYFVMFDNYDIGEYQFGKAIWVDGNEELIEYLQEEIDNGTINRTSEGFDTIIQNAWSRKRSDNWDNAESKKGRMAMGDAGVHRQEQRSGPERHTRGNDENIGRKHSEGKIIFFRILKMLLAKMQYYMQIKVKPQSYFLIVGYNCPPD